MYFYCFHNLFPWTRLALSLSQFHAPNDKSLCCLQTLNQHIIMNDPLFANVDNFFGPIFCHFHPAFGTHHLLVRETEWTGNHDTRTRAKWLFLRYKSGWRAHSPNISGTAGDKSVTGENMSATKTKFVDENSFMMAFFLVMLKRIAAHKRHHRISLQMPVH